MISIIPITTLLFSLVQGSTTSTFTYRLTNSTHNASYCIVNSSTGVADTTSSNLKVGEYYENGSYYTYYSVLRFTFPAFSTSNIQNAKLTLNKSAGSTSNIQVYYAYGEVGFSNTNWTYLTSVSLTGNSYSTSILSPLTYAIDTLSLNCCYFKLAISGTSNVTLQGDTSGTSPYFFVTTTETKNATSGYYGCATTYQQMDDIGNGSTSSPNYGNFINCYGYAIDTWRWITITEAINNYGPINTDSLIQEKLIPFLINQMKCYYDVNARQIASYDDAIYPFERRIAFRKDLSSNDFHFMRQTDDGRWADKKSAPSVSSIKDYGVTPDNFNWYNDYDSETYYFAINNNGGSQYYVAV